jgi:protease-4
MNPTPHSPKSPAGRRLRLATLSILAVAIPTPAWALPPQDLGIVPSAALYDDAAALAINPAGLGAHRGLSLLAARDGWSAGSTWGLMTSGGLAFGYHGYKQGTAGFSDVLSGLGAPLGGGFHIGMTYHLPSEGRPWQTDVGLLYRPLNYLSLGAVTRNAFAAYGALEAREYQLGAAFRPFGPALTLSIDGILPDQAPLSSAQTLFGAEARVMPGLSLRGSVTPAGEFRAGLGLAFSHWSLAGMSDGKSATTQVRFNSLRQQTRFARHNSQWATLELKGNLADAQGRLGLIGPTADVPPVYGSLRAIEAARQDPRIGALILKIDAVGAGWATVEEVRAALMRFKEAGKTVWAYVEAPGAKEYYLASAAHKLVINPVGSIELVGLSREFTFYKGLFDQLGIRPHFIAIGRFKSFAEPFTRKNLSEANREQQTQLLDDQYERMVASIAEGRGLEASEVKRIIDEVGMIDAPEALDLKLVDGVMSRDEVSRELEKESGRSLSGVKADALRYVQEDWAPPAIAIIHAAGGIRDGESGNDLFSGASMGSETMVRALRQAREDSAIKAVVLRVDSPGGSAIASEVIRREAELLAEAKPVVVSMGDVAASGGYWISMLPKATIYADAGTITGSIGVVMGKFSVEPLLERWGLTRDALKRGDMADYMSLWRGYSPEEEERLKKSGEFFYGRFVGLVSKQRGLSEGQVREMASGRVYTGAIAQRLGLVDKVGGLAEALQEARAKAGIGENEVRMVFLPERDPFAGLFTGLDGEIRASVRQLEPWLRNGVWLLPATADGPEE